MRRRVAAVLLLGILMPLHSFAATQTITRRDGFLLLWQSIHRALEDNREKPFVDVPKDAKGFPEITYAKYRGIIDDDEENFRPDDPLKLEQALVWLYRTRSVDDLSRLTPRDLPALLIRYPLGDFVQKSSSEGTVQFTISDRPVTEEQLMTLMRTLDDLLAKEVHEVSLYSEKFNGKGTAFGDTFDMHELTAAHRTFPHNTQVKVTNVANGKSVTVRINDRGPYVDGRDMDLSLAAFTSIEDRSKGVLHATFQRLGDATLIGQCDDTDVRRAVRITKNVRLIGGVPATLPLGKDLVFRSTRAFVLRSVRYPDGTVNDLEDWILPGESHPFRPSLSGEYVFILGSKEGRRREVRMGVVGC